MQGKAGIGVISDRDTQPLIMRLNPDTEDFGEKLSCVFEKELDEKTIERYRANILQARTAGIPLDKKLVTADE